MNTADETSGPSRPKDDPGCDSERYRAVFFATQEALVIINDDGRYVDANDAYAKLLKTTRPGVIGRHFSDFMPPDRLREAEALFAALKRGEPGVREFPLRAIDGAIVPCEWNIRAGFLSGLTLCSARDITHRLKADEELRASEARFRAAVSAAGNIVWTNTSDGRMEGEQPGWAGFTGQTIEQYRGYGWAGALHPEDAQPTIDAWNQAVAEHRMFVFEHRVRRKDGVYRLFSIRAVPVLDEHGAVREWVGVHTDITDERNLTATLRTNESQFRFLTALDDATRPLTDPESVVQTAARMLGEYLGADNIAYCHFDADEETFHITGEYRSAGAPTAKGHYNLSQFGGALRDALRSNKPYVVSDVEADARTADTRASYRALGIRANVAVPLYKAGRLVASMGVHQLSPREWKLKEIDLLQQVANRCWESIERVRAEDDLRKQWHTFDTVLSHTPDFTYTFDLNGRFTYINRALLALWQKSLEEARGKDFFELDYPPELAARLQSQIQQVIETRALVRDHTPYTDLHGSTGHYEYIFFPVFSSDGHVEAVAGATRDVTEHEKMARALADSEQKLQQIFAQAPVAVVVFRGRDFVIEMANPFYEAILNGRKLQGRKFADVAPDVGKHVWEAFYRVLDTGEPFIATDWYVPYDQNGDGEVEDHWFNVVYHPLRETDGTVSGMVAVCSDETVQVRARLELESANRELEEFAFVSSHDLQEPLRMVGIYTELLLSRYVPDDPTAKQYGAFIKEGVQRMEKLIRDLLTYSRVIYTDGASGKTADLNESLQQALQTLANRIAETSVKVTAAPLPRVQGDSAQLMHVFQNLISNSLKYRDAQRPLEIRVSAEQQNGDWIISVQDNGIGFEQQYSERIFGLFKRLHKEEYAGTGLGLAICQRIIERYGGRIWAEGRLGEGATFRFSLPGI